MHCSKVAIHKVPSTHRHLSNAGKCVSGKDGLVLDAPQLRMHYPKLILAMVFEIPYIVMMAALALPESAAPPVQVHGTWHRVLVLGQYRARASTWRCLVLLVCLMSSLCGHIWTKFAC